MNKKQVYSYLSLFTGAENFTLFTEEDLRFIEYHLSRQEEKDNTSRDQQGNWDFTYTDFDFSRPYLDEFVITRLKENYIARKNIWKNNKPFAIWLTHDLDLVSDQDPVQLNRKYKKLLPWSNSKIEKITATLYLYITWFRSFFKHKKDLLWHYEKWFYLEKHFQFTSTWFVFARPPLAQEHLYDCSYIFNDTFVFMGERILVSDFIKYLHTHYYEVGLHGSYNSALNANLLKTQKNAVENETGAPVDTTRQHFLRFDINTTPAVQEESGFKTDSTLGFKRNVGFRAGTCYPFYINNAVLEIPMIIMDTSLFRSMNLNLDEAMARKKILDMFNKVERAGGCLTINFHPNNFIEPVWWRTYEFILEEAKKRNAHCTSAREMQLLVEERISRLADVVIS